MSNFMPFKPTAVALIIGSIFAMPYVAHATTYGVDASNADQVVTDKNSFSDVDYGVYVSKDHSATVTNDSITINAKKGGAFVKNNYGGTIGLTATAGDVDITVSGGSPSDGLDIHTSSSAKKDSRITVEGKNVTITSTSPTGTARGVLVENTANTTVNGHVEVTAQQKLKIGVAGTDYAKAVGTSGAKSSVTLKSDTVDISSVASQASDNTKGYAYGVHTSTNAITEIEAREVKVNAKNLGTKGSAVGLYASDGTYNKELNRQSTINVNADTLLVNATSNVGVGNTKNPVLVAAVAAYGDDIGEDDTQKSSHTATVNLSAKNIQLSASGQDAYGVSSVYGGKVTLGNEETKEIVISSVAPKEFGEQFVSTKFTGLGAYARDANQKTTIVAQGKQISVIGDATDESIGVYAGSNSLVSVGDATTDTVTIRSTTDKNNTSANAIGVWVENNAKTLKGKIGGEAKIAGKSIDISAEGAGEVNAIFVASNLLDPKKKAQLSITGDNIKIHAKSTAENGHATAITAFSAGVVSVIGNTTISADNAIVTRGDSQIAINKDGQHSTKIEGNILFDYDADTSGTLVDATVDLTLVGADSYWTGNVARSWSGTPNDTSKLDVTGMNLTVKDGAQWTPTNVASSEPSSTVGKEGIALNNLALDNGVVNVTDSTVKVNVENMSGSGTVKLATDLAAEEGKQAGTFTVASAAENSKLTVKLTDKKTSKELTSDQVTADQAKKLMGNIDAKDTEKKVVVDEGMYNSGFDIGNDGSKISHGPNNVMQSSLELATAAPLALNRILMNDVRKRLGDVRTSEGTSGAWARYDGGRLSGSNGLENDFHTIQIGVDTQPTTDPVRFGVAFSYTTSDTDYARGSADMDAYSLAGYGVWFGENGQFVDVVARMATAKTDMTVDGTKKGAIDNVALSLSGEFGWRLDMMNNFYVEPQIEGTYTYVDADELEISGGYNYKFDAVDSFLGRVGMAFGMKCPNNKGNVYARVSAVHEFLGDTAVTGGNGSVYSLDGKDTWVEYGLGANFNLTPSTYVWADVERTSGGALDEDYRATVGARYVF